jgi:peptidoglycan/LPS O-acetylase OafA/YrhL
MTIIMLGMNIYWKCGRDGGAFCPTVLKPIVWLGEQSFDVYLFHMIIMRPMIVLFENSNIEYPLQQLLLFGGTLGGSVIILLAKEQISKKIGKRTD